MKFSTEFSLCDIALGLTAVACVGEKVSAHLDGVRVSLQRESHETIFDRAQEICNEYGSMLRIEQISHVDMIVDNVEGFSVTETQKGWICALWNGTEWPMMPNDHKLIYDSMRPPEMWTVIRAYSMSVN